MCTITKHIQTDKLDKARVHEKIWSNTLANSMIQYNMQIFNIQ